MKSLLIAACAAAAALMPASAWAQTFPSQPIRIIVPFAAGGNVDVTARAIAPVMSEVLGQPVVVENRPGAGGMVGAGHVMSSKPDGHTILMGSNSTLSVGPSLYKKWPYDPIKGITPISNIQRVPFALVVRADSDVKTVADIIRRAKAKPGDITMGHGGIGSGNHLTAELFQLLTGTRYLLVPFKGAAPAMTALLADQIQSKFDQASTTVPQVQAGKVRALAVTGAQRMASLPDVPTFAEAGVKDFEVINVTGLLGPAGMDPAVVDRIREAAVKALATPAVNQLFTKLGVIIDGNTPKEFAEFIRRDLERWSQVVKEANIQVN